MLSIDELKKCYPLMKNRQCLFEQALSTNELKKRYLLMKNYSHRQRLFSQVLCMRALIDNAYSVKCCV